MSDKQRKLFLLLLPAAIVLFGVFVWFEFKEGKPTQEKSAGLQIDIPDIPNGERQKEKEEIFAQYERKEMNFNEERKNIKSEKEDFFGLAGSKSYSDIEEIYNNQSGRNKTTENESETEVSYSQKRSVQNQPNKTSQIENLDKRSQEVKKNVSDNNATNNQEKDNEDNEPFQTVEGFGIAYGDGELQKREKISENITDFIKAELLSEKKIRDNSELIFILDEDYTKENITFNRMAKLFCTADIVGDRIEITCNTIRNTDGKIYNMHLRGYNENYQRGIRIEGKIDKAVNETSNEVLEEGSELLADITGFGSDLGDIMQVGTDAMEKEVEILLKEGYIMLFRDEN
jgi:hypothetical protein